MNYTIPSDNRELQRSNHKAPANENYTVPSDNEENQKSILKLRKNRNQPLHYNKKQETLQIKVSCSQQKSARRDSNPRPRPWQGRAPPTEPLAHM